MGRSGEEQSHPETVVPNVMFTTWTLFHWTILCKKKHQASQTKTADYRRNHWDGCWNFIH